MLADITAALAEATRRLEEAQTRRVPRKALAERRRRAIASVQKDVQEAGSALGAEDYLRAQEVLKDRAAGRSQRFGHDGGRRSWRPPARSRPGRPPPALTSTRSAAAACCHARRQ
jgi:hypothetical protein